MKVTRTERGWVGHFCMGSRCMFRRNTLLECGDRRVVVSTVGNMWPHEDDDLADTIGRNRYYETMVFEAIWEDPYWDADISRQLFFDSSWTIPEVKRESDQAANDMHERVVEEITRKMEAE